MTKRRTYWLETYREVVEHRKQGPDFKLIEHLDIVPRGPVLDLGMGRGRHALFFAKLGYQVDGVDTSTLSKGIPEVIEAEGLDFTFHRMDLREFEIQPEKYALIIASKVIQLFRKPDIEALAERMEEGLKPKGIIYIYTFSVEDLQHVKSWDKIEKVEENTYYHSEYDLHFHFFSRKEILGLFPQLKLQYFSEGLRFDRSPSRHRLNGFIQYIGQKPG
ncbi:class I SAM-dependent methyltransferase [Candidatus Thorarchaeota archaeon]|nr:MAG: class I SAM-dependent methyltransferase [Candidatus Thorarchaeota archaeon]